MTKYEEEFKVARWMAEDLAGMLPDEEKRALQEWIAASEGHAALYEEIRKDFKEDGDAGFTQGRRWRCSWRSFTVGIETGNFG